MGWSAGSSLMQVIIESVKANVPNAIARRRIYDPIVRAFDDCDWDTHRECIGADPIWDDVLQEIHPGILMSDEEIDEEADVLDEEDDIDDDDEDDDDEDEDDDELIDDDDDLEDEPVVDRLGPDENYGIHPHSGPIRSDE